MVRMLKSKQQDERDELMLFITTMAVFRDARFSAPVSMAASLEKSLAAAGRLGRPVPLSGLRDAAHDLVAWSRHIGPALVREADAFLRARGSVTLTAMGRRISK